MSSWNAKLYLQFANERTQPSIDLAARIAINSPKRMIDLGCGPGNSTHVLRKRWPDASIEGLDSSNEMISAATASYPNQTWKLGDIATYRSEIPYDIVFSNAALQWLPNHDTLFPHIFSLVAPQGALAVQVPAHYQSPVHNIIQSVSRESTWNERMHAARHALNNYSPSFYYDVLRPLAAHIDIWETEYYHIMESQRSILEWFRGTGLRPFLDALKNAEEKQIFEQKILEGYIKAYPTQKDGKVLFPFRRLFIIAYRG